MMTVEIIVLLLSVEMELFGTKVVEHKLVMMETTLSMMNAQDVN
jgi:hypothetical protein